MFAGKYKLYYMVTCIPMHSFKIMSFCASIVMLNNIDWFIVKLVCKYYDPYIISMVTCNIVNIGVDVATEILHMKIVIYGRLL